MPVSTINGVRLYWEEHGEGPPVVLVHGSWGDHHNWDAVVPALARSFRVTTYDRRGHSQSERPNAQGTLDEDVADLAALLVANDLAPAHVVGNSGGAIVSLKLAVAHPGLLASIAVHEPPLLGMIQDHPVLPAVGQRIGAVVETLRAGDMEAGARLFVENIAFGPGAWAELPADMRRTFIYNAPTFLDESNEPIDVMAVDLDRLAKFRQPMLLTQGDESAPFFGAVLEKIAAALPSARRHVFRGAGHVPHVTTPDQYVGVVGEFLASAAASARAGRFRDD